MTWGLFGKDICLPTAYYADKQVLKAFPKLIASTTNPVAPWVSARPLVGDVLTSALRRLQCLERLPLLGRNRGAAVVVVIAKDAKVDAVDVAGEGFARDDIIECGERGCA